MDPLCSSAPSRTMPRHRLFFLICFAGMLSFLVATASAQERVAIGDYQVSGPYHYKNLSVFLVHGKDRFSGRNIITLEEALTRGIVKVYETGSVNELEIENLSKDTEVYIQAGDIVKGGQQDRTLGIDLTLAPNSGRIPIASFCVEHGRWTKRGEEPASEFTCSNTAVASNSLRLAIRGEKNQSQVWDEVSVMQTKLSDNLGVQVNAIGATVPVVRRDSDSDIAENSILTDNAASSELTDMQSYDILNGGSPAAVQVNPSIAITSTDLAASDSSLSNEAIMTEDILDGTVDNRWEYQSAAVNPRIYPAMAQSQSYELTSNSGGDDNYTTSLQLSLENKELVDEVEEYMAALQTIIQEHDNVIGFAFTINGEMKNADIYGSGDLFQRLWPKLLRAAATEAVAERNADENPSATSIEAVRHCFLDADAAAADKEEVNDHMIVVTRKSDDNVLFETQEKGEDNWLHRNYMKLE